MDHAEPYEGHQLYGDTANYYCKDGYTAGNNSKMVCDARGAWTPPDGLPTPRCIANFCLHPPALPHAVLDAVRKPKYASNTEVAYKCEEGFVLNTTAALRCLVGGAWEPPPREVGCVAVRCSRPEGIERGYVSGSDYSFGAVVAYSCDRGFLIRGEKRRTCEANGAWGGPLPTCGPVACLPPPSLRNGYIQVGAAHRAPPVMGKHIITIVLVNVKMRIIKRLFLSLKTSLIYSALVRFLRTSTFRLKKIPRIFK